MSSRQLFAFAVAAFLAVPAAAWEPEVVGLDDPAPRITPAPATRAAVDPASFITPEVVGTRSANAPAAARQDPPGRTANSSRSGEPVAPGCART